MGAAGLVNDAHPAFADLRFDTVAVECSTDHRCCLRTYSNPQVRRKGRELQFTTVGRNSQVGPSSSSRTNVGDRHSPDATVKP
jgi:hypothetical protein